MIIPIMLSSLLMISYCFTMDSYQKLEIIRDYEEDRIQEIFETQNRIRTDTLIRALITNEFVIKNRENKAMIRVKSSTHKMHYFTLNDVNQIVKEILLLAQAKQAGDEKLATRALFKSKTFPAFAKLYENNIYKKHNVRITWLQFAMHDEQRLFSLSSVLGDMLENPPQKHSAYFTLLRYGLATNDHETINAAKNMYPTNRLSAPSPEELQQSQQCIIAATKKELLQLVPRKKKDDTSCCTLM